MNKLTTKILELAAVTGVGLALAAMFGSCRTPTPKVAEPLKPLAAEQVKALVDKALPTWDGAILAAKEGPAWSAQLGYNEVLSAMHDEPAEPAALAAGARRIESKDRILRLEPENGRVRYIHRGRAWTPDRAGAALTAEQAATTAVRDAVAALGLPGAELGRVRVDTQVAESGVAGERATTTHEFYRLVTVSRLINGLPVSGSTVRAAVNHAGAIQRLAVRWPAFVMPRGQKLRSRDAVAAQVVAAVMRQGAVPAGEPFVTARLAYAPERHAQPYKPRGTVAEDDNPRAGDDDHDEAASNDSDAKQPRYPGRKRHAGEVVRHVPVVIVSVLAGETPYQLTVPVVEL